MLGTFFVMVGVRYHLDLREMEGNIFFFFFALLDLPTSSMMLDFNNVHLYKFFNDTKFVLSIQYILLNKFEYDLK